MEEKLKNLINKISPEWILRISLAIMYFYSGFDLVRHPKSWYWAVRSLPNFAQGIINYLGIDLFLQIQGFIELIFAVILILWFLPKVFSMIVAILTTVEMALILIFVGIDGITFRDIGLLGASISLYIILRKNRLQ